MKQCGKKVVVQKRRNAAEKNKECVKKYVWYVN